MRFKIRFGGFRIAACAIALLAAMALPCFAGEVAVLKNGFSIRHERREVVGDITRLYVNADGSSFVDVRTADIEHYETASDLSGPDASASSNIVNSAHHVLPTKAPAANLGDLINEASGRYRLDPDLVSSVIKAESGFNVRAVSPKGAQGLMQLMPATASGLGVANTFDPRANVEGGTKYLRELLERYNFDLVKALAAYNAGPQRVEQFGGVPPYHETRAYVARVVRDFNKKKAVQQNQPKSSSRKTAVERASPATNKPRRGYSSPDSARSESPKSSSKTVSASAVQ